MSPGDLCLPVHPVTVPRSGALLCLAVPSVPEEVAVPTSHPASHTSVPGIALDPEKAGGCCRGDSIIPWVLQAPTDQILY